MLTMKKLLIIALLSACGDDIEPTPDAGVPLDDAGELNYCEFLCQFSYPEGPQQQECIEQCEANDPGGL